MTEVSAYELVKRSELERYFKIGEFNRRMSENPLELIRLSNEMIEDIRKQHMQRFTNQLYNLMLRKANGEYN